MNSLITVIDIIGIVFELFIVVIFCNLMFGNQDIAIKKKIVFYSLYFICLFLAVSIKFFKPYIPFIAFFATFLIAFIYKQKLINKIIYSVIIFSMLLTSEILVGLTLTVIWDVNIETTQVNVFLYFSAVIFSKFILFIILKICSMLKRTKDSSMRIKELTPIVILPISSAYWTSVYTLDTIS